MVPSVEVCTSGPSIQPMRRELPWVAVVWRLMMRSPPCHCRPPLREATGAAPHGAESRHPAAAAENYPAAAAEQEEEVKAAAVGRG